MTTHIDPPNLLHSFEHQKNASLQKRSYEVEQGLVDDSAEALDNDEEGGDGAGQGLAGIGNIMMAKR